MPLLRKLPNDLPRVLRYVRAEIRRMGFDAFDLEILSAINYAVALSLTTWNPSFDSEFEKYAVSVARNECVKTVAERFAVLTDLETVTWPHRSYVAFGDGRRFASLPWSALDDAATDFCVTGRRETDHYACGYLPPRCLSVSAANFDRLICQPVKE